MTGALRNHRFHISFLLGWWSLAVCLGLLAANYMGLGFGMWWLMVALALFIGAARSRRIAAVGLIIISGLIVGTQRGDAYLQQMTGYQSFVGQEVTLNGRVAADPVKTDRGQQRLDVTGIEIVGRTLPGEVYVVNSIKYDIKRGDIVTIQGELDEGFGSYQATIYRAKVSSIERPDDVIRDIREKFAMGVRAAVREPEASLGLGFVVGQRSALPPDLDEQLRMVGLTHIVVASGYNLTILVRFARRLLAKFSRFQATTVSGSLMLAFAAFSGFSPSMNRAVLVTGLSLLAWHYGRRFHPLLLIVYVAAATAYFYPVYIWGDIGWYLSFLAFAGVLMVAPLLQRVVLRSRQARPLEQVLFETASAQLMTLPLILLIFAQLPTLALVANLLVALAIPFAMAATATAGLVGMIWPSLASLPGFLVYVSVGYVVATSDWLAAVPGAQVDASISFAVMIASYAVIAIVTWLIAWRLSFNYRSRSIVD